MVPVHVASEYCHKYLGYKMMISGSHKQPTIIRLVIVRPRVDQLDGCSISLCPEQWRSHPHNGPRLNNHWRFKFRINMAGYQECWSTGWLPEDSLLDSSVIGYIPGGKHKSFKLSSRHAQFDSRTLSSTHYYAFSSPVSTWWATLLRSQLPSQYSDHPQ